MATAVNAAKVIKIRFIIISLRLRPRLTRDPSTTCHSEQHQPSPDQPHGHRFRRTYQFRKIVLERRNVGEVGKPDTTYEEDFVGYRERTLQVAQERDMVGRVPRERRSERAARN